MIRTEGSWLDIGTSISHYVIVMAKIIIVSLLFTVSQFLFKFELLKLGIFASIHTRLLKFE